MMKNLSETMPSPVSREERDNIRWLLLRQKYLPVEVENSIWRYSRRDKVKEPSQGWKLHVSATVLNACDIFERIAPFLLSLDIQFKAPFSLYELSRINSGLHFGYSQIGKFITIYPRDTGQAVQMAKKLHALTAEFASPAVPFDEQFLPYSCVYYRYGAFRSLNEINAEGRIEKYIKDPSGKLVSDDRLQPIPEWLSDPFKNSRPREGNEKKVKTPLDTEYRVVKALSQRGKGGVYLAIDLSGKVPRWCVIKEGRRNGEASWDGFDGYRLVKNEHRVLRELEKLDKVSPKVLSFFELDKNYYLVVEHVEGKSLHDLMKLRRRRFSLKQTIRFSLMITEIMEKLHRAGWVWTDCKPANLIVTPQGDLRPVDFEGAHPIGDRDVFDWKTAEFSLPNRHLRKNHSGEANDLYSLGTVLYFLLTGRFFQPEDTVPIRTLRPKVPRLLEEIVNTLTNPQINDRKLSAAKIRLEFENLSRELRVSS